MLETHRRLMNQARNFAYTSENLSIRVRFTFLGAGIFEVKRGITVSDIKREAIREIIIGIPI